ncbi:hypothetical protein ACF07D_15265 [Leucobacter sp. NPDC015123]|uniref:hypothetical protein n=1 Tax=Leucobacter sp. NPDC015123 TaxID=3364129 RepID=UPI0036F476B1
MSLPQSSRRRIGPAVAMTLAILGSLALLAGFVFQVATASPGVSSKPSERVVEFINESLSGAAIQAEAGELRPETLTVLEQTDEGVVAVAFLTTKDALGIGVYPAKGGASSVSPAGLRQNSLQAMIPGDESTRNYELSVRRVGTGDEFEHTFTAK